MSVRVHRLAVDSSVDWLVDKGINKGFRRRWRTHPNIARHWKSREAFYGMLLADTPMRNGTLMVRQQADSFLRTLYSMAGHSRSCDREGCLWLFVEGS